MESAEPSSSGEVLKQLAEGSAQFEFVEKQDDDVLSNLPFASISAAFSAGDRTKRGVSPCFAKIGGWALNSPQTRQGTSPALKNIEYFDVKKIAGDGRCMFRALVLGMAANKGTSLNYYEEEQEADQLRMAVMEAICRSDKRTKKYEEALIAITVEESIQRYCQRIPSSNFWGGESELLVLSRMCGQPIIVYIPESEAKGGWRRGGGYMPIAEYGNDYRNPGPGKKGRKPVRLLYSGSNHYDLLV